MTPRALVALITTAATPHIGPELAAELARNVTQCVVGDIPIEDALTTCVMHRRRTPAYGWPRLTGKQAAALLSAVMQAVDDERGAETLLAKWRRQLAAGVDPAVAAQRVRAGA